MYITQNIKIFKFTFLKLIRERKSNLPFRLGQYKVSNLLAISYGNLTPLNLLSTLRSNSEYSNLLFASCTRSATHSIYTTRIEITRSIRTYSLYQNYRRPKHWDLPDLRIANPKHSDFRYFGDTQCTHACTRSRGILGRRSTGSWG